MKKPNPQPTAGIAENNLRVYDSRPRRKGRTAFGQDAAGRAQFLQIRKPIYGATQSAAGTPWQQSAMESNGKQWGCASAMQGISGKYIKKNYPEFCFSGQNTYICHNDNTNDNISPYPSSPPLSEGVRRICANEPNRKFNEVYTKLTPAGGLFLCLCRGRCAKTTRKC